MVASVLLHYLTISIQDNMTPIMKAAQQGRDAVVSWLIVNKVDLEAQTKVGYCFLEIQRTLNDSLSAHAFNSQTYHKSSQMRSLPCKFE